MSGKNIELNSKLHKKEKVIKKNKNSLLRNLLIGSLFGSKKAKKKVNKSKAEFHEEEELEEDDFHYEDPD